MEPTSTGHKLSASIPKQAVVVEIPGSWGLSMPHPILRLRSCKAPFFLRALSTHDDICDQRLLAFSSFEPSSWAPGNDIHLGILLPLVRHWLCIHSNMATAVCLSPVTRHWDGN